MCKWVFMACLFLLGLLSSCHEEVKPEEIVGQTAKAYYDGLIKGDYEQFVDGRYQPDSIPASYREQLVANAKMFIGEQQETHKGIKSVSVSRVKMDKAHHVANVFLILYYGDGTKEEILVPMILYRGVWYTR